jgi:type IV secretion system protein VirB4
MPTTRRRWIGVLPDVLRIFTSADGSLFSETYNQLNAYFAVVPGN